MEARALLAATAQKKAAEEARSAVQAAAERAERHRDRCTTASRSFASLDDAINEATIGQLRDDGRVALPDSLRQMINDREVAKADFAVAERAAATLGTERD